MTPPRFIPFADMTEQEQREHLRRVHGLEKPETWWSQRYVQHRADHGRLPDGPMVGVITHTHDKPARTRTEENS